MKMEYEIQKNWHFVQKYIIQTVMNVFRMITKLNDNQVIVGKAK